MDYSIVRSYYACSTAATISTCFDLRYYKALYYRYRQSVSSVNKSLHANTGLEPALLGWYGYYVELGVNKLGGLGACSPRKNF